MVAVTSICIEQCGLQGKRASFNAASLNTTIHEREFVRQFAGFRSGQMNIRKSKSHRGKLNCYYWFHIILVFICFSNSHCKI
jgi:hypothetical protein